MKLKLAECVAVNQEAVVRYNATKAKPASTSKSTDSLVKELLSAKKRPNPEAWALALCFSHATLKQHGSSAIIFLYYPSKLKQINA